MSTYQPRLRPHLQLEDGQLVDALLKRDLGLEGTAAALAARLDGTSTWPAIRDALIAEGHEPGDLDAGLRSFLRLYLVEGAGDEVVDRLQRLILTGEEVATTVLAGARFGCQGSGGCCHGYRLGPLAEADVATLARLDLATAFPGLDGQYLEEREEARYLRRVDDRCVFLLGDRRCGLHAAFGAEAKPGFCRLYPLEAFATVEGVRVVDRGTCASFGVSARSGLPIVDDVVRLRPLLGPFLLYHPIALVDGEGWDYGLFLRFTDAADTLIAQGLGTATETLHALGRCLDALASVVASCPLEAGQPDAFVDSVLAVDPVAWYRPPRPAAAARGVLAVVDLLGRLAAVITETVEEGRAGATGPRSRELVALILATAAQLHEGAPEPAPCGPDVDEALRISLQQQLFGQRFLVEGHAGIGLVRLGLVQLLALSAARTEAGDRPLRPLASSEGPNSGKPAMAPWCSDSRALTARDLSRGHMLAVRVFETRMADELLAEHEPSWRPLLDGLAHATRLRLV